MFYPQGDLGTIFKVVESDLEKLTWQSDLFYIPEELIESCYILAWTLFLFLIFLPSVDGREMQEHVFYLNEVWFCISSIDIEVIRAVYFLFISFMKKF